MVHIKKWWKGNFQDLSCSHSNNYIKAWHKTLKYSYLGSARKRRSDNLTSVLLQEVPDFRCKVVRVYGLDRKIQSNIEIEHHQKFELLADQIAKSYISHETVPYGDDEYSENILIRSFTDTYVKYQISLNSTRSIASCSC